MNDERKMYVEMPLPVHTYDVDFMGIVNNSVYVKWLEDLHPVQAPCHVRQPLDRPLLDLDDRPQPLGCRTHYRGRRKSLCHRQQTGYYFNIDRRRPVPFPDELLEKFMTSE